MGAHRRMQKWITTHGKDTTAARGALLMALKDAPEGSAMGDVGRDLDVSASTLSGLLDRMEASGLVRRASDPDDGRAFRLHLTAAGRDTRNMAIARSRELNAKLTTGFTDDELDVVARWLTSFTTKFDQET